MARLIVLLNIGIHSRLIVVLGSSLNSLGNSVLLGQLGPVGLSKEIWSELSRDAFVKQ